MFFRSPWTRLLSQITVLATLTAATPTSTAAVNTNNGPSLELDPVVFKTSIVLPNGTIKDAINPLSRDVVANNKIEAHLTEATLVLTMGTKWQHIGYTKSRDVGSELRDILNSLCDDQEGNIPGEICKREPRVLHNIMNPATNNEHGTVTFKVVSDYIPNAPGSYDNAAILTLFQDQIVQAFRATIACDKNRYWHYRPISEPANPRLGKPTKQPSGTYICWEQANSAGFYEIAIEGFPGDKKPHMRVEIESLISGDSECQFDCIGTLSSAWSAVSDHRVKYQYAKALNVGMSAAIKCGDKEGKGGATGVCDKFNPHSVEDGTHCLGEGYGSGPPNCEKFYD